MQIPSLYACYKEKYCFLFFSTLVYIYHSVKMHKSFVFSINFLLLHSSRKKIICCTSIDQIYALKKSIKYVKTLKPSLNV